MECGIRIRVFAVLLLLIASAFAEDLASPKYALVKVTYWGDERKIQSQAAKGYCIVAASVPGTVVMRLEPQGHCFYRVEGLDPSPNGLFNQFNSIGAQSYGVLLVGSSDVIFEKRPSPKNHHYFTGRDAPPGTPHSAPPLNRPDLMRKADKVRLPIKSGARVIRAVPFFIVEAPGEYQPSQPADTQEIRFLNLSDRDDQRFLQRLNQFGMQGAWLCGTGYTRHAVTLCYSGSTVDRHEYRMVKAKKPPEIEAELNLYGADGFRVINPHHLAAYGSRVFLERTKDPLQVFRYRAIEITKDFRSVVSLLEAASSEGFEPVALTTEVKNSCILVEHASQRAATPPQEGK